MKIIALLAVCVLNLGFIGQGHAAILAYDIDYDREVSADSLLAGRDQFLVLDADQVNTSLTQTIATDQAGKKFITAPSDDMLTKLDSDKDGALTANDDPLFSAPAFSKIYIAVFYKDKTIQTMSLQKANIVKIELPNPAINKSGAIYYQNPAQRVDQLVKVEI